MGFAACMVVSVTTAVNTGMALVLMVVSLSVVTVLPLRLTTVLVYAFFYGGCNGAVIVYGRGYCVADCVAYIGGIVVCGCVIGYGVDVVFR